MKKSVFWLAALSILAVTIYFFENPLLAKTTAGRDKAKQARFSELQSGDIVFQVSESGQGKAIQLATHSEYTHCGIIFREGDKILVYEAVQPVRITAMEDWIKHGNDEIYIAKRLKDDQIITPEKADEMKQFARTMIGKNYDIYFNWSDDEIYCSELVWKIYHETLSIDLCETKPLRDFDLSQPAVKKIMSQRYGENIPMDEPMVSPGDLFESAQLAEIHPNP